MFDFKLLVKATTTLCLLSSPLCAMITEEGDKCSGPPTSLVPRTELSEQQIMASSSHSLSLPVQTNSTNEDKFNFLSNKYPLLGEEAGKSFKQCAEETKHYKKLEGLVQKTSKSPEGVLLDGAKDAMGKKHLHWAGEEYEKFYLEQMQPMIETLEKGHPKNGYFNTFFSRALQNHTSLEDILLASEYIFQVVKDEGGGTVLFLGRTPCVVQVAYEEVLKVENDKTQVPVHLNFSGHPDALTKRESDFFKSQTNITRDIVTPEKLSHYFSYLDTKNLLNTKKLFVVDIIGSGSSLNSFLRIINDYYEKRQTKIPELSFLNLTADMNWSMDRSEYYTFKRSGNRSNQGILTLPEDARKNMTRFQVPVYGVPIFDKILTEILDQDMFQEFLVHGIQYPAQKWTPEFDAQRDKGGQYHSNLYAYLRLNYSNFIKYHQKTKL
ncbi:MAG: hypothetical protein H0X26_08435 [Alphaproteobacteria bacterium]|nr:hypothetical protein [Alphaproteobacteria bacterium]